MTEAGNMKHANSRPYIDAKHISPLCDETHHKHTHNLDDLMKTDNGPAMVFN